MPRLARREPTSGNGLRQLLDLEAGLARQLAAAREEADDIRKKGEEAALATRRAGDATIDQEEQALARQSAEHLERETRKIRDDLARNTRAMTSIPSDRIDAIARGLLNRLIAGSSGGRS
jgi:hypothetical protein